MLNFPAIEAASNNAWRSEKRVIPRSRACQLAGLTAIRFNLCDDALPVKLAQAVFGELVACCEDRERGDLNVVPGAVIVLRSRFRLAFRTFEEPAEIFFVPVLPLLTVAG